MEGRTWIGYVRRQNTYVGSTRTLIEYVRRLNAYVDGRRTSIEYVRGYARRRKTRTLVEHIRRKTRTCIVEICSRDVRTSSGHVRQANTYADGRRTSVEYARQRITYMNITSPSHVHRTRGKCVRHGKYVRRWKTYVSRICTRKSTSPNLYSRLSISQNAYFESPSPWS